MMRGALLLRLEHRQVELDRVEGHSVHARALVGWLLMLHARTRFRSAFQAALAQRPLRTPRGIVLLEMRSTRFGYPGGSHEPTECWAYRPHDGAVEMLLSFYSNFTDDDLICKVNPVGKGAHDGAGASIQFNGDNSVTEERGVLTLRHHGRVTVTSAISRAALVETIRKNAADADAALGGLDADHGWPLRIGSLADVTSLLDRLFLYAYAVEQAKRALRRDAPLPPVLASAAAASSAEATAARLRPGQGFQVSPAARRAIELHAMTLALKHYREHWPRVDDVSGSKPYDLHCSGSRRELRVEVKGTTGDGSAVLLTPNEVEHALTYFPDVALFIVSRISLELDASGQPSAVGGACRVIEPWDIETAELVPLSYACIVGPKARGD